MRLIKYEPTELATWHELIRNAQTSVAVQLEECIESYLVMLLMRFMKEQSLADSVLGVDYLACFEKNNFMQREELQKIGDKCLLFSGLFPGNAEKRHVKISYFIELGQSAYYQMADIVPNGLQSLYIELSHTFIPMRDVLQATRSEPLGNLSGLAAMELWEDTGSKAALKQLQTLTDATPIKTHSRSLQ